MDNLIALLTARLAEACSMLEGAASWLESSNQKPIALGLRAWVEEKGFKKGGGSPIRIDSQADLHKFENALKDFRFNHTLAGYDVKRAILDFAVWLTVNLNYAPQS